MNNFLNAIKNRKLKYFAAQPAAVKPNNTADVVLYDNSAESWVSEIQMKSVSCCPALFFLIYAHFIFLCKQMLVLIICSAPGFVIICQIEEASQKHYEGPH